MVPRSRISIVKPSFLLKINNLNLKWPLISTFFISYFLYSIHKNHTQTNRKSIHIAKIHPKRVLWSQQHKHSLSKSRRFAFKFQSSCEQPQKYTKQNHFRLLFSSWRENNEKPKRATPNEANKKQKIIAHEIHWEYWNDTWFEKAKTINGKTNFSFSSSNWRPC